jgi:hypothetical protein
MAVERKSEAKPSGNICTNPVAMHQFLSTLLDALHLQAKEIERLTSHVEQQTDAMLAPSQMPVVVSELSSLVARLDRSEAEREQA